MTWADLNKLVMASNGAIKTKNHECMCLCVCACVHKSMPACMMAGMHACVCDQVCVCVCMMVCMHASMVGCQHDGMCACVRGCGVTCVPWQGCMRACVHACMCADLPNKSLCCKQVMLRVI